MKEDEENREAALASTPCLKPNFRSAFPTQSQISKFQELHRKRLQIKAKSNKQKKHKVKALKLAEDDKDKASVDARPADPTIESTFGDCSCQDDSPIQPGESREQSVLRTRQKLYWGLDVKERWERKSNM